MSDIPGDPWAALLVGHQWPGAIALETLSAAALSRRTVEDSFHGYADTLRSISDTMLSGQDGHAAEGIRSSFRAGEHHARGVAERNAAKRAALTRADHSTTELRSALTEIAERGGGRIRAIAESAQPAPAKIAAIVHVVQAAHTESDTHAALCMENVYGSIQHVLDTSGSETSARQFAHAHGVRASLPRAPHPDVLYQQVQQLFEKHYGAAEPSMISGAPPRGQVSPTPVASVVNAHAGRPTVSAALPPRTVSAPAGRTLPPYGADMRTSVTASPGAPISASAGPTPLTGPTTTATVLARTVAPKHVARARTSIEPTPELLTLLRAVARQEPTVRWAIGVIDTPVLATDLASGWVPPHVDIPAGVGLLEPAVREGDLKDWFGPDAVIVRYEPGSPIPDAGDTVPMRDRAGLHVDDLGWKLVQATRWREGLPRLSHTAAKAAAAGLDLLPSEATQLRTSLGSAGARVLGGCPATADGGELENWQLLAAVTSLVDRDIASAHYHFAWFQTRTGAPR